MGVAEYGDTFKSWKTSLVGKRPSSIFTACFARGVETKSSDAVITAPELY